MHYDEFQAMNSAIVLAASGNDLAVIKSGFSLARMFINQSEERFTRFTDSSELARLNRSAGEWFQASLEMFQVLEEARRLAMETNGLFNPAILPVLKQAGYDRSMEEIKNSPDRMGPTSVIEVQDFRLCSLTGKLTLFSFHSECKLTWVGLPKAGLLNKLPACWQK